jgi:hypothetical protein
MQVMKRIRRYHCHRERRFHRARPSLGLGWDRADVDASSVQSEAPTAEPERGLEETERPVLRELALRGMRACALVLLGLALGLYWKPLLGIVLTLRDWARNVL